MRSTKKVLDALNAARRDVALPVASLNLANPLYHPGVRASNVNRPETKLPPSMTSDLSPGIQRSIMQAHYRVFGDRRSFSTSSDAPGKGEIKVTLKNGTEATLSDAGSDDASLMPKFYETLSNETILRRWGKPRNNMHIKYLQWACENGTACIARNDEKEPIGVVQLTTADHNHTWATCAIVISDDYQNQGLGTFFMDKMLSKAEVQRYNGFCALTEKTNIRVLNWWNKKGAIITDLWDDRVTVEISLPRSQN